MKTKILILFNVLSILILSLYIRYVINNVIIYNIEKLSEYEDIKRDIIIKFSILLLLLVGVVSFCLYNVFFYMQKSKQNKYYIDYQTKFYTKNKMWMDLEDISVKNLDINLIYVDIDNLKKVNDTYGHIIGDVLIEHFTSNVLKISNKVNCYRFGGDEFIIIIENNILEVKRYIEQLNKISKIPIIVVDDIMNQEIKISAEFSIGVASTKEDSKDIKKLVETADKRMYEEKKMKKSI